MSQSSNDEPALDLSDQVEAIAIRLKDQIIFDLDKLEAMQEPNEIPSEQRLKCITASFKLLQTVEETINRNQREREKNLDRGVDILEFRKQLEEQIASLVDTEIKGVVS